MSLTTKYPNCRDCLWFHANPTVCVGCLNEDLFESEYDEDEEEQVGGFIKNKPKLKEAA